MALRFECENCRDTSIDTLYEGWFYAVSDNNPFAKGTATSGLIQRRKVCEKCLKILKRPNAKK